MTPPGGGGGGSGEDLNVTVTSLRLDPKDAVVDVDGTNPAAIDFHVYGTDAQGVEHDITKRATLRVADTTVGNFSGPQFTAPVGLGGITRVTASVDKEMLTVTTNLTLRLSREYVDPTSGLPANVAQQFATMPAGAAKAASLVYPNDGVTVPPNLGKLEFHLVPPAGHQTFELSFINPITKLKVYFSCTQHAGNGCIYTADATVWQWLASTNRGGAPVLVAVKTLDAGATEYGQTATTRLSISLDDLQGALYYWTTNGRAIMRWDFGSTTQTTAEKVLDGTSVGGGCPGCHALASDGSKLIIELSGEPWGGNVLWDIAKKAKIPTAIMPDATMFESWNPTGSQYVGIPGRGNTDADWQLGIYDGMTGTRVLGLPQTGSAASGADYPDWSADGTRIAYVRMHGPVTSRAFMKDGGIEMITDTAGVWGMPEEIVPAIPMKNSYHPAFAPDNELLAFSQSTCGPGGNDCDTYSDPNAKLFVVKAKAGSVPIELIRANQGGLGDGVTSDLCNSYPKWSPFLFTGAKTEFGASRLEYLSFSSSRRYGLRPQPYPNAMYVWMASIDPDKAIAGEDPSSAAFVLPFQDLTTSNHIPQWTHMAVPLIN